MGDNSTLQGESIGIQQAKRYALIDLHLHLDGSLSPEAVIRMARMSGVELPTEDIKELEQLLKCPENCESLNDYLKCFDLPVEVMQTKEAIAYSVTDLIERLNAQGLLYAEIRFAPQLHMKKGLSQEQVVEAAIQGLNQALNKSDAALNQEINGENEPNTTLNKSDMNAQLILCCMRGDNNEDANMETVRLTKQFLGKGVAACDLAGAEALFNTAEYKGLFDFAKAQGVPFTIHAGEADGVSSVNLAVSYGAKRIGHGIRTYNEEMTKKHLVEKMVTLELCPTSNMNTKAVDRIDSMDKYPIEHFLADHVHITINTDNMMVSDTTVEKEFEKLFRSGVITEDEAVVLVHNAVKASFLPMEQKKELLKKCDDRMTG